MSGGSNGERIKWKSCLLTYIDRFFGRCDALYELIRYNLRWMFFSNQICFWTVKLIECVYSVFAHTQRQTWFCILHSLFRCIFFACTQIFMRMEIERQHFFSKMLAWLICFALPKLSEEKKKRKKRKKTYEQN